MPIRLGGARCVQRILLPLNPSQNLEVVQEYTLKLAQTFSAEIVPLYVVPVPEDTLGMGEVMESGAVSEALRTIGQNKLKLFERQLGDARCKPGVIRQGRLIDEVLAAAEEEQADLIVLGGFSTPLTRTLVGSDVERIIEYTKASVLVVRGEAELPRPGQSILIPCSGVSPLIKVGDEFWEIAERLHLKIRLECIAGDPDEAGQYLEEIRSSWRDSHQQVEVEVDVTPASWFKHNNQVSSYKLDDVALVVMPRFDKGATTADTRTPIMSEFVKHSTVPVLILQKYWQRPAPER